MRLLFGVRLVTGHRLLPDLYVRLSGAHIWRKKFRSVNFNFIPGVIRTDPDVGFPRIDFDLFPGSIEESGDSVLAFLGPENGNVLSFGAVIRELEFINAVVNQVAVLVVLVEGAVLQENIRKGQRRLGFCIQMLLPVFIIVVGLRLFVVDELRLVVIERKLNAVCCADSVCVPVIEIRRCPVIGEVKMRGGCFTVFL